MELENVFHRKVKGHLGETEDCDNEVRVLNHIVRLDDTGVMYEADPRHAEMLIQSGGLQLGNAVSYPGAKLDDVNYDAVLEDLAAQEVSAGQLDGEHTHDVHLPQEDAKQKAPRNQTRTMPRTPRPAPLPW